MTTSEPVRHDWRAVPGGEWTVEGGERNVFVCLRCDEIVRWPEGEGYPSFAGCPAADTTNVPAEPAAGQIDRRIEDLQREEAAT